MVRNGNTLTMLVMLCAVCSVILLSGCCGSSSSVRPVRGNVSPPPLKWKVSLGDGGSEDISGDLVVDNGVLYINTESYIYALDVATGKTKLKDAQPGYALSSPAVANNMLYLGTTSSYDQNSRIATVTAYALDSQIGGIIWQRELSHDRSEDSSNPIVADGLVYFGTGWSDYSCCEFRGNGGHIIALDAKTGQVAWHLDAKGDYGSGGSPTSTFAVANGMLYFGAGYSGPWATDRQLHALDAKTGKEVWKVASDVSFPILAPDGSLYTEFERELAKLDGKTGQEQWRWKLDSAKDSISRPSLSEDTVYVMGNDKRDMCFDSPCPPPKDHTDTLYALDSATGQERWKQDVDGGYYGTPDMTLFNHYLVYDTEDRSGDANHSYLRALDRNNGKLAWQVEIDKFLLAQPAVADNTIFVGTSNGTVYAFQAP